MLDVARRAAGRRIGALVSSIAELRQGRGSQAECKACPVTNRTIRRPQAVTGMAEEWSRKRLVLWNLGLSSGGLLRPFTNSSPRATGRSSITCAGPAPPACVDQEPSRACSGAAVGSGRAPPQHQTARSHMASVFVVSPSGNAPVGTMPPPLRLRSKSV
jgi:hypothetical protein